MGFILGKQPVNDVLGKHTISTNLLMCCCWSVALCYLLDTHFISYPASSTERAGNLTPLAMTLNLGVVHIGPAWRIASPRTHFKSTISHHAIQNKSLAKSITVCVKWICMHWSMWNAAVTSITSISSERKLIGEMNSQSHQYNNSVSVLFLRCHFYLGGFQDRLWPPPLERASWLSAKQDTCAYKPRAKSTVTTQTERRWWRFAWMC